MVIFQQADNKNFVSLLLLLLLIFFSLAYIHRLDARAFPLSVARRNEYFRTNRDSLLRNAGVIAFILLLFIHSPRFLPERTTFLFSTFLLKESRPFPCFSSSPSSSSTRKIPIHEFLLAKSMEKLYNIPFHTFSEYLNGRLKPHSRSQELSYVRHAYHKFNMLTVKAIRIEPRAMPGCVLCLSYLGECVFVFNICICICNRRTGVDFGNQL